MNSEWSSDSSLAVELEEELVARGVDDVLDEAKAWHALERAHERHVVLLEHHNEVVLDVLIESAVADDQPRLVERAHVQVIVDATGQAAAANQAASATGQRQARRLRGLLIEDERFTAHVHVALEEGARRHVVRDAVGQVGDNGLARVVGLLAGDAQVASKVARDRREDGVCGLERLEHGQLGLGLLVDARRGGGLDVDSLHAPHASKGLLGDGEEASAPLAHPPLHVELVEEAIVVVVVAERCDRFARQAGGVEPVVVEAVVVVVGGCVVELKEL